MSEADLIARYAIVQPTAITSYMCATRCDLMKGADNILSGVYKATEHWLLLKRQGPGTSSHFMPCGLMQQEYGFISTENFVVEIDFRNSF